MLTRGFFTIFTVPADYQRERRAVLKASAPPFWSVTQDNLSVAEIAVYEREDACTRLMQVKREHCLFYGGTATISFVRSMTKAGAAKLTFEGKGEVIESFRPTLSEINAWNSSVERHDLDVMRELISRAHARIPKLDPLKIPQARPEAQCREARDLLDYISALVHFGALESSEYEEMTARRKAQVRASLNNYPQCEIRLLG